MIRLARSAVLPVLLFSVVAAGCGGGGGSPSTPSPQGPSNDAALSAVAVSAGTLTPAFAADTVSYAVTVANGTATFAVTPTARDAHATIQVRQGAGAFASVASGAASAALAVPAVGGSSTITLRVTAEDGVTVREYAVVLAQDAPGALSSDAALSALAVSAGTLTPAFAVDAVSYAVTVANGTATFAVTPTARDAHASIQVRQDAGAFAAVASGAASAALTVPAVGGSSTITLRVTAEDGATTRDYVVTLAQDAPRTGFVIYGIGDSTMAYYDPATYPNQRGWGQMFPQFITSTTATFVDAARNGRSSRSFYDEGSWEAVRVKLLPGDYVFIQFAHNDEKANGLDGLDGIGTAPFGTYQTYLRRYVDETVAAGAIPVLVTPVVRRYFSGATLTPKACHDLTGVGDPSIPVAQDLNYVEAMKQVATEKGCLLVDMTASTKQLVESYGPTDSKSIIYVATDDTHLQPLGATMFAQLAVQELIGKGVLVPYLNASVDLVVSPTALAFGSLYIGMSQDRVLSVTGLALTPATGSVIITAPDPFLVGTAGGTFASTLELPYTGGRLAPTNVVVRFVPAADQAYSGDVTIAPGSGTARTVGVTGTGVPIPSGGTESVVTYALTSDATCAATGLATCAAESFSGLYAKNYQVPNSTSTTWLPSAPATTITQRVTIVGDTWPGSEIDLVATRYVQFAVAPAAGHSLAVDQISLWAGAAGGANLGYRIQYDTHADFSAPVTLLDAPSNATNTMVLQSFTPILTVNDGETLYVRVFPWLKGASASGKYLCLQSVTIHGMAQ
jgi:lysophospholipase L1-like esterase